MKSIYFQFHSNTQKYTQRKKPRSYYWPTFAGTLLSLCLSGPGFSHVGSVVGSDHCRIEAGFEETYYRLYKVEIARVQLCCKFIPNEGKNIKNVSI